MTTTDAPPPESDPVPDSVPGRAATGGRRPSAVGAPLGPGSLLWSIAGDPRSLIPGTAAGIMQLMLPGLGAGVTDHSNFFDDPFDRIFRSIPVFVFFDGDMKEIARFIERPPKITEYMEQKQLELRRQLRAEHGAEWQRSAVEEIRALLG